MGNGPMDVLLDLVEFVPQLPIGGETHHPCSKRLAVLGSLHQAQIVLYETGRGGQRMQADLSWVGDLGMVMTQPSADQPERLVRGFIGCWRVGENLAAPFSQQPRGQGTLLPADLQEELVDDRVVLVRLLEIWRVSRAGYFHHLCFQIWSH